MVLAENRHIDQQNRIERIDTHIFDSFMTKEQKYTIRKEQNSINGAGKTGKMHPK